MTKHVMATAAAVAALALAGCGQKAETTTTNTVTAETTTPTTAEATPAMGAGQTFANAAAASDTFEIESSRLADTNGASASVKRFAASMIAAHTESTAKLKTAAAGAAPAITPDPTLTPEQQAKLDAMKAARGTEFDRLYIAGQQEGHQKTLDTLRAYSSAGDVPTLKAFATEMAPKVAAHLNTAKGLKA